jgi:hypothetical protein
MSLEKHHPIMGLTLGGRAWTHAEPAARLCMETGRPVETFLL